MHGYHYENQYKMWSLPLKTSQSSWGSNCKIFKLESCYLTKEERIIEREHDLLRAELVIGRRAESKIRPRSPASRAGTYPTVSPWCYVVIFRTRREQLQGNKLGGLCCCMLTSPKRNRDTNCGGYQDRTLKEVNPEQGFLGRLCLDNQGLEGEEGAEERENKKGIREHQSRLKQEHEEVRISQMDSGDAKTHVPRVEKLGESRGEVAKSFVGSAQKLNIHD